MEDTVGIETKESGGMKIDAEDEELDKVEVSEGMEIIDGVEDNEGIDGIEGVGIEIVSDENAELNIIIMHNSVAAISKNLVFFIKITFQLFFCRIFSISVFHYKKSINICKYIF